MTRLNRLDACVVLSALAGGGLVIACSRWLPVPVQQNLGGVLAGWLGSVGTMYGVARGAEWISRGFGDKSTIVEQEQQARTVMPPGGWIKP